MTLPKTLLALVLLVRVPVLLLSADDSALEQARRFLPRGAQIVQLRTYDPKTGADLRHRPAVALAHLRDSVATDLVFVYTAAGQLKLRVVLDPSAEAKIIDRKLPGDYLLGQGFRTVGFQVRDFNGDGRDEVLTASEAGASVGGWVELFALQDSELKNLLPPGARMWGIRVTRKSDGRYAITTLNKLGSTRATYEPK